MDCHPHALQNIHTGLNSDEEKKLARSARVCTKLDCTRSRQRCVAKFLEAKLVTTVLITRKQAMCLYQSSTDQSTCAGLQPTPTPWVRSESEQPRNEYFGFHGSSEPVSNKMTAVTGNRSFIVFTILLVAADTLLVKASDTQLKLVIIILVRHEEHISFAFILVSCRISIKLSIFCRVQPKTLLLRVAEQILTLGILFTIPGIHQFFHDSLFCCNRYFVPDKNGLTIFDYQKFVQLVFVANMLNSRCFSF